MSVPTPSGDISGPSSTAATVGYVPTGKLRISARVAWILFAVWFVALTILSSIHGDQFGPTPFSLADKLVHVALFATGTIPLALASLRTFRMPWPLVAGVVFVVMAGIAVLDEFHQLYTPGRSGMDPGDMSADAIGAAIGLACALLIHARRRSKTGCRTPITDREA